MCWDCRGTGHAHDGRCRSRFLDWWHLKEGAVVITVLAWTILTTLLGAPVLYGQQPGVIAMATTISVGPALLAILALIIVSPAADRQIRRYGLPSARRQ
jgi:hypothetical protein